MCTHNSARSQTAEALLTHYGGSDFEVASAGTEARASIRSPSASFADAGIDWSHAESKTIDRFEQRFDYVITVCDRAKATCPVFPRSENTLHWGLDDPSEVIGTEAEKLAAFRGTEMEVSARLRPFIEIALRGRRTDASSLT